MAEKIKVVVDDLYDPGTKEPVKAIFDWDGVSVTGMQDKINSRQNAGIKFLLAKVKSLEARVVALEGV